MGIIITRPVMNLCNHNRRVTLNNNHVSIQILDSSDDASPRISEFCFWDRWVMKKNFLGCKKPSVFIPNDISFLHHCQFSPTQNMLSFYTRTILSYGQYMVWHEMIRHQMLIQYEIMYLFCIGPYHQYNEFYYY